MLVLNFMVKHRLKILDGISVESMELVSRSQTTIFAQGRYRFQYKRPARKRGAYTESDNAPVRK